jgi:hypothetical protein
MNLKGFSGCEVELKNGKVIKTSPSFQYNDRLKKQRLKQSKFKSDLKYLSTPKVLSSAEDSFSMEYAAGKDFVSFLSESGKKEIDKFSEDIFSYVQESISFSETQEIDSKVIKNKILQIYDKKKILCLLKFIDLLPDKLEIPIGTCHGDLTLSNIIFQKNKLILIDFLDGFIETPLIDIAKLRQDTSYKWSLDLYQKSFDKNKINISLDYLDVRLHDSFLSIKSYKKYYLLFQFLNFARILPYTRKLKKINYLRGVLSDIVSKL